MIIRIAGIDTSMSNVGLAFGTYDTDHMSYIVDQVHLIHTGPSKDKKVRKSAQDYERCRSLYSGLRSHLGSWRPSICFAEMPTGSQSANGMKSYGISLMLLGTIGVPVVQVSPQEVKVASVDSKTASKRTMIEWAVRKFPNAHGWLKRTVKGQEEFLNKNEHMADAIGSIEAGMRTDQWLQMLSIVAPQKAAPSMATPDESTYL